MELLALISYLAFRCDLPNLSIAAGILPVAGIIGALAFSVYDHLVHPKNTAMP